MFSNHLKSTCRILLKNKLFSLINILGLAIGMGASLLIFQYVAFEKSFDRFHKNPENIFRIQYNQFMDGQLQYQKAQSFIPLGEAMTREFSQVTDYTTLFKITDQYDVIITNVSDKAKSLKFTESNVYHVKGNFFNIFNLRIIEGNPGVKTVQKGEVLISRSMAKKYFGDQPAINKLLHHAHFGDFKVTGVFEDTPRNSHINFNFLFGWESVSSEKRGGDSNNWYWDGFYNYIRLNDGTDATLLEGKFPYLVDKYIGDNRAPDFQPVFLLQPITDIHLHSNLLGEASENGDSKSVATLFILAFLILSIAWANYVSLSTSGSIDRAKEVGIRKSLGSTKNGLIKQFLVESFVVNFLALLTALSFTQLIASVYFEMYGKTVPYDHARLLEFSVGFLVLIAIGSILSGIYPAYLLSSLNPVTVLKSSFKRISGSRPGFLRKVLVVFQFTISMGLIAGAVAIFKQVSFMQQKDLGINLDHTLVIKTLEVSGSSRTDSLSQKGMKLFRDRLSSFLPVSGFAASTDIPGKEHMIAIPDLLDIKNKSRPTNLYYSRVDPGFMELFEAKFLAGRSFSGDNDADGRTVIINVEALDALGFSTPHEAIGARINRGNNKQKGHEIIGVVDFRATSFKEQNYPVAYQTFFGPVKYLSVKLNIAEPGDLDNVTGLIRNYWEDTFPDIPFDYFFLDEMFDQQYKSDQQFSNLLNLFTGLAIFVACLGLYGLSSYMVKQKTKEIGIRKVLGAPIHKVVGLLTKDVMTLILISALIAIPIVVVFVDRWLSNYPFKVEISWWVFVAPVFCVALITALTIGRQVFKATKANLPDSLNGT